MNILETFRIKFYFFLQNFIFMFYSINYKQEQSDIPTDIALALGHNFVEVYDIDLKNKKYEVHSEVNCIM